MVMVTCGRSPPCTGPIPAFKYRPNASIRPWARRFAAGRTSCTASPSWSREPSGRGADSASIAFFTTSTPWSSNCPLIGVRPVRVERVPKWNSIFDAGVVSSMSPSGSTRSRIRCAAFPRKFGSQSIAVSTRVASHRSRSAGSDVGGDFGHGLDDDLHVFRSDAAAVDSLCQFGELAARRCRRSSARAAGSGRRL